MTASQQTSSGRLPALFQRFQIKVYTLRVNEIKITSENGFNGDHFRTEGNHGSSFSKKILFWVYFQIFDPCFNS